VGLVVLADKQREEIELISRNAKDNRTVRRALGIIWLEQEKPTEIARRLNVTRQTVYNWLRRWNSQERDAGKKLQDIPRPGRPAEKREMVAKEISTDLEGLKKTPEECGYQASAWTASLIARHLERTRGAKVHENTVKRTLREMGFRWKRPRYTLARRDPNWRQAKGGLKRG